MIFLELKFYFNLLFWRNVFSKAVTGNLYFQLPVTWHWLFRSILRYKRYMVGVVWVYLEYRSITRNQEFKMPVIWHCSFHSTSSCKAYAVGVVWMFGVHISHLKSSVPNAYYLAQTVYFNIENWKKYRVAVFLNS